MPEPNETPDLRDTPECAEADLRAALEACKRCEDDYPNDPELAAELAKDRTALLWPDEPERAAAVWFRVRALLLWGLTAPKAPDGADLQLEGQARIRAACTARLTRSGRLGTEFAALVQRHRNARSAAMN